MNKSLTILALLLAASTSAHAEQAKLTILHTTDLHGALTAWDYLADRPAPRGLEKLGSLIRIARADTTPTLLLDAGDALQGSPLQTVWREGGRRGPEPILAAMNALGYDAMALGNHEFDHGLAALDSTREQARFPFLAVNVVRTSDQHLVFPPSVIRDAGPLRVGVVGVVTPSTPEWLDPSFTAGVQFLPPIETVAGEVGRLRDRERCDVIVVLAHTGLEKDPLTRATREFDTAYENWAYRLMTEVGGVDVWILGHTHETRPQLMIGDAFGAQAGKHGEALGRVDVELTRAGPRDSWLVSKRTGSVIAVTDSTPSDPAIVALAADLHAATRAALDEEVGRTARAIDAPSGRFEDGPLWGLLHAAQRDASHAPVSLASMFDASQRLGPGPITRRDLSRLYPYDNTLVTLRLSGAQLAEALEHAALAFAPYTYAADRALTEPNFGASHFDAASGVSYEIDLTRPPGDRIVHLSKGDAPLGAGDSIEVVTNSYRAGGGGGYRMLARATRVSTSPVLVRDAIAQLLRRGAPEPARGREWNLLPDYATTVERPLIDRLVREQVLPAAEVQRIFPREPAQRGELAYWLARAFEWREKRPSGAFADVPDSLEPWLDGLVRRRVLGAAQTEEMFGTFATLQLGLATEWCERAARVAGYALAPTPDRSFRRGLAMGVGLGTGAPGRFVTSDTLTRVQALALVANTRFPTLRILETTDFHGGILGGGRDRRTGRAYGGSVALAGNVKRLSAVNPEGTVLVDGGDWYQGTMISNLVFGRPMIEQMNALGYSAAAIGNHEFDWSADTLIRRIHEFRGAALGANIRERKSGKLPRWARSDTLMSRRGVRLGILGLSYPGTPNVTLGKYVAHLRFLDDSATAVPIVDRMRRKDRVDAVIGIGHIPASYDSARGVSGDLARLARGVKGVDAWFGGHSHNVVPGVVDGIPALISGSHGEWLGVCDLVVDPLRDRVIERKSWLERTYADLVVPDSAMAARVERWNKDIAPVAAAPVGRNINQLFRNRGGESTVGNLVADAMREGVAADIALQNAGGLRADLRAGAVTRGDIYEVMPFDNTVVTLTLTGAQVKQALEDALRYDRVTQVSGIRYEFDTSRPAGARLVTLVLADGTALDERRDFKVAVNNFMADGGDNYSAFAQARDRAETGETVREFLEAFVRAKCANGGALQYRDEGRIKKVGGGR
ncbi:MAG: hypothetical protein HOP12_10250 [Candidatus Eisenbacteria bacterium]|uniref:Uncharacterized protein n=1 Tax=Eiseniibacteriota bacterium TaxID=2212470 RepID=A0A849SFL6_UNCEI|nr:hypothetical protein [Candidatus Eisenbacteria bacterium]